MTDSSPPARRLAAPRWRQPRVALGVLLIVGSVVAGARIFAGADRYSAVYVARTALVPGERLAAVDLGVGRVRFDGEAAQYVAAGRTPAGYVVTRYVAAGELLPLAALRSDGPTISAGRFVTVPVGAGHLAPDLARGQLVDVYLTVKAASGGVSAPALVASAVPVDSVGDAGSLSAGDTESVDLVVPAAQVAAIVRAVESGIIDLVRVPDPVAAGLAAPAGGAR